jgi:hypothetical protein
MVSSTVVPGPSVELTDTKPPWFFTIECDVADRARCPAAWS